MQESNKTSCYRNEFIKHSKYLRSIIKDGPVNIAKLFVNGSTVICNHMISITKRDGIYVKTKVIAFFEIKKGKNTISNNIQYNTII